MMVRRMLLVLACVAVAWGLMFVSDAEAQQAYQQQWGSSYSSQDWNRLYHYPYVWYPQNFWGEEYYRSSDDMYYRYPAEMRIPVYNRQWHNPYPETLPECPTRRIHPVEPRRYHKGHHFQLDVF